jgi:hypothetical protein
MHDAPLLMVTVLLLAQPSTGTAQGTLGFCFINQRPQQGQCLVQICRAPQSSNPPRNNLTRSSLYHSTIQAPHLYWFLMEGCRRKRLKFMLP